MKLHSSIKIKIPFNNASVKWPGYYFPLSILDTCNVQQINVREPQTSLQRQSSKQRQRLMYITVNILDADFPWLIIDVNNFCAVPGLRECYTIRRAKDAGIIYITRSHDRKLTKKRFLKQIRTEDSVHGAARESSRDSNQRMMMMMMMMKRICDRKEKSYSDRRDWWWGGSEVERLETPQ